MLPIMNSKVLLEAKYVAWDVSVFFIEIPTWHAIP